MSSGCVLEAAVGRLVDREATSGRQQTFAEIWCLRERLRFQEVFLVSIFFGRLRRAMAVTNLHNFLRVEAE